MSNEELLEIYKRFDGYLQLSSWGNSFLRSIGFGFIKVMAHLLDQLSNVLYDTIHFLGFYSDPALSGDTAGKNLLMSESPPDSLFSSLAPFQQFGAVIALLAVVAILFLGKSEETREIPKNVLSILIIIGLLPSIMSNGIKIITATSETLTMEQGSLGLATIKENTIDMYAFVDTEWRSTNPNPKNKIEDLVGIDINETVSDNDSDSTGVLNNRAAYKAYSSEKSVMKLDEKSSTPVVGGMINLFLSRYYRWHVSWLMIILNLLALLCSLVLSILRCGRLGMEVTTNYLLANLIAFFSFTDMKRLKQCVMGIITSFITILTIFVMFYIFLYYMSFVKTVTTNNWTRLFGIVGGGWLLYDGPAVIQQLFGVDAGLGTAGAVATVYGIGSLKRLQGFVGNGLSSVVGVGGTMAGFIDKNNENKDQGEEKEKHKSATDRGEKNQDSSIQDEDDSKSKGTSKDTHTSKQTVEDRIKDSENEELDENDKNTASRIPENEEKTNTAQTDTSNKMEESNSKNEKPTTPDEELDYKSKEEKNRSPLEKEEMKATSNNPTISEIEEKSQKSKVLGLNDDTTISNEQKREKLPVEEVENIEKTVSSKNQELEKPNNPFLKHLDEKLSTPKQYEEKGSTLRNSYDRVKKGYRFGQDIADYRQERREYKNKYKSKEKNKEE